jgi:hypothetical protein
MLSLYPARSLTRNIGTDGSGTHATDADKIYDTSLRLTPVNVRAIPVQENKQAAEALRRYYRRNFAYGLGQRIRRKLKRLLGCN